MWFSKNMHRCKIINYIRLHICTKMSGYLGLLICFLIIRLLTDKAYNIEAQFRHQIINRICSCKRVHCFQIFPKRLFFKYKITIISGIIIPRVIFFFHTHKKLVYPKHSKHGLVLQQQNKITRLNFLGVWVPKDWRYFLFCIPHYHHAHTNLMVKCLSQALMITSVKFNKCLVQNTNRWGL